MNAPPRYERFVVPEGVKKVSHERDTKIVNAAAFTIEREDHTIGNLVRMELHRDPTVLFAGYKLPHPLLYKVILRIQTTSQSSPTQAYTLAVEDLDKELLHLKRTFEDAKKQVRRQDETGLLGCLHCSEIKYSDAGKLICASQLDCIGQFCGEYPHL